MLVAACHDFLTQSGVGMRPSSSCCGKNLAPVVNRAADGSYVYDRHFSSMSHKHDQYTHLKTECEVSGRCCGFWMGAAALCNLLLGHMFVIYEPRWVILAKGLISVAVLWFCRFLLILPTWRSWSRYMWRCSDSGDLFLFSLPLPWKPFVIHSALLVQLENSTGIKAHLPKSVVYAGDNFSCIAPCRQQEPGEAIHLVWNCMLTLCLLLMSSFRFSSKWQPIKIGQKSFVERS